MLITSMSELNYISLFWAYGSLYLVLKYKLVYRIRSVIPNNTRLEWDSNLTTQKQNKFLYIKTNSGLLHNESFRPMFIVYLHYW